MHIWARAYREDHEATLAWVKSYMVTHNASLLNALDAFDKQNRFRYL